MVASVQGYRELQYSTPAMAEVQVTVDDNCCGYCTWSLGSWKIQFPDITMPDKNIDRKLTGQF